MKHVGSIGLILIAYLAVTSCSTRSFSHVSIIQEDLLRHRGCFVHLTLSHVHDKGTYKSFHGLPFYEKKLNIFINTNHELREAPVEIITEDEIGQIGYYDPSGNHHNLEATGICIRLIKDKGVVTVGGDKGKYLRDADVYDITGLDRSDGSNRSVVTIYASNSRYFQKKDAP